MTLELDKALAYEADTLEELSNRGFKNTTLTQFGPRLRGYIEQLKEETAGKAKLVATCRSHRPGSPEDGKPLAVFAYQLPDGQYFVGLDTISSDGSSSDITCGGHSAKNTILDLALQDLHEDLHFTAIEKDPRGNHFSVGDRVCMIREWTIV